MEKIKAIRTYLESHTGHRNVYHRRLQSAHEFRVHNDGRSCWIVIDDNVIDGQRAVELIDMLADAQVPQTCRETAGRRRWVVTSQGVIQENVPGEHL